MVGEIFDDLTVIEEIIRDDRKYNGDRQFLCKCNACGRVKTLTGQCIREGRGTTHKACARGLRKEHPRLQRIWQSMKTRVYNPNFHSANSYSGKGLTTDWDLFIDFFDDMAESYYAHAEVHGEENTTLERSNIDIGYLKSNCRWATWEEQHNNTSVLFEVCAKSPQGELFRFKNISKFAREHNISGSTIKDYLKGKLKSAKGWHFWTEDPIQVEKYAKLQERHQK